MENILDIIYVPLGWIIRICYELLPSYVFALLLFAVIIKVLMIPLSVRQHKNSLKQASLRPREAAIIKKYKGSNDKNSMQKKQEEIQLLYQKENYSQFAGCLPMLIQLPLVVCIYNIVRSPLRYICGFSTEVVKKITDLAGTTDQISALDMMRADFSSYAALDESISSLGSASELPDFHFLGLNLAMTPKDGSGWLLLVPVLTFLAVFFSSKLIRKMSYKSPMMESQGADTALSMKIMDFILPLISTYISFTVPSVIGIYWIYQNLLGVVQQLILVKVKPYPVFTEQDYKDAERLMSGKSQKKYKYKNKAPKEEKDPDRPRVRSLHHIDDEEYNAKVVETEEQKKEREANSEAKRDESGLLAPMPMKDYSDKKNKK